MNSNTNIMNREPEMLTLTADHITYRVRRLQTEHSNIRLWAIQKQNPTNEAEYAAAETMSLYWYYHHKFSCEYNAAIERKIANIPLKP